MSDETDSQPSVNPEPAEPPTEPTPEEVIADLKKMEVKPGTESVRVTGCRVFLNQDWDDRLKGFGTIILNNEFAICDLKIVRGNKGLFVAMPSRRRRDGSFHDVALPIVLTLREHIESVVLNEYRRELEESLTD